MSRYQGYLAVIPIIMAGLTMSTSHAKPDLTTPVNMNLLHAEDTGYHFVHHDFNAPPPELPLPVDMDSRDIQNYAKPRQYRVWLAVPTKQTDLSSAAGTTKAPKKVLYMLDGNAVIDDLSKDTLQEISTSSLNDIAPTLVFIGYQTPYRSDVDARAYDFTPPLLDKADSNAFKEENRERLNGGAEQFFSLIEKEIKPWVYEQLGEKPNQEALWGHSYGGLFVLYNLFEHPESYQQFFSADPSLWWQDGEMLKYWSRYQELPESTLAELANTKQIRLTFSGSPEQLTSTEVSNTSTRKADFAKEIEERFQKNASHQFYNQSHGEVFATSLLDTLKRF
ncbi:alpha/beta hydrolase [Psychrobacter sp.]|uniref:alpha/beta hydrolase n=1 Tax=Psychrobacter sp. TaxID=56811 RepID=UPI0026508CD7|nr:hypothetical protein [Psychrobacter sp.]